jgi:hypothetical protein
MAEILARWRQQALLFVIKKKQKNFGPAGCGSGRANARGKQKFFGSFFQKRTAFFFFRAF